MNKFIRKQGRGISLIEAVVALAVMAVGMLALVGVQSKLRSNSDAAKQRAEGVRLAQEAIEEWRSFVDVSDTTGQISYTDLRTLPESPVPAGPSARNAAYTWERSVNPLPDPLSGKLLRVDVRWADREGQTQAVTLSTVIAGIAPELAATLSVPAGSDSLQQVQGRSRGIPPGAKNLDNGSSGFIPTGAPAGVVWVFDNLSGALKLCNTSASTTSTLTAANVSCAPGAQLAVLLSGYIRFALTATQPTVAQALAPLVNAIEGIGVQVARTAPSALTVPCFTDLVVRTPSPIPTTSYAAYYCAVPIDATTGATWSGTVVLLAPAAAAPPFFAATLATTAADQYKACRYFASALYDRVNTPKINQNYLVIQAGNGSSAFTCPNPDPATPTLTWPHQPST
jgi:type II secretory pathway pseudopilin PulG